MADVAQTQLIVATHGDLACALVRTAELIAGPQTDVKCVTLAPGEAVEAFRSRLMADLRPVQPTLILVDLFGGTPWNVAVSLTADDPTARVVSGVNLPMLLEVVLSRRTLDVAQLALLALETGAQAVKMR